MRYPICNMQLQKLMVKKVQDWDIGLLARTNNAVVILSAAKNLYP